MQSLGKLPDDGVVNGFVSNPAVHRRNQDALLTPLRKECTRLLSLHFDSVNISHNVSENVFADMRQVIKTRVKNDVERIQILSKLSELEESKDEESFIQKYQEFIASAADHLTILAPFIPALTQMLK